MFMNLTFVNITILNNNMEYVNLFKGWDAMSTISADEPQRPTQATETHSFKGV